MIKDKKKIVIPLSVVFVLLLLVYLVLRIIPNFKTISITTWSGVTYEIFDDHAEVSQVREDCSKNIIIKNTILGRKVTIIDDYAFFQTNVETVVVSDSVEIIGEHAFDQCLYLTKVTLGNHVREIRDSAFCITVSLREIEFPESLEYIGKKAFLECGVRWFKIPQNVKVIETSAFYYPGTGFSFEGIEDLNLHVNAQYLGDYENPEVEFFTLYHSLLYYNGSETSIVIPDDVYYVNTWFPKGSTIYLHENVKAIDLERVLNETDITVYIPKSVTHLCAGWRVKNNDSKIYVIEDSEAERCLKEMNEEQGYHFNYEVISENEYPSLW